MNQLSVEDLLKRELEATQAELDALAERLPPLRARQEQLHMLLGTLRGDAFTPPAPAPQQTIARAPEPTETANPPQPASHTRSKGRKYKRFPHEAFTPARMAVLARMWPTFATIQEVRAEMARLPGVPLPDDKVIGLKAAVSGLRRPAGFMGYIATLRFRPDAPKPDAAPTAPAVASRPAPPAAKPPATRPIENVIWTPARLEVLRRLWPTMTPTDAIRNELVQLPGRAVPNNARIGIEAAQRGLRRPAGFRAQMMGGRFQAGPFSSNTPVEPEPSVPLRQDVFAALRTLRSYALELTDNKAPRAEALMQQTAGRALARFEQLRPGTALAPWLRGIMQDCLLNPGRATSAAVEDASQMTEPPAFPSDNDDPTLEASGLDDVVETLPDNLTLSGSPSGLPPRTRAEALAAVSRAISEGRVDFS